MPYKLPPLPRQSAAKFNEECDKKEKRALEIMRGRRVPSDSIDPTYPDFLTAWDRLGEARVELLLGYRVLTKIYGYEKLRAYLDEQYPEWVAFKKKAKEQGVDFV